MKTFKRGILISIEGIDGSGKTVLAKNIYNFFLQQNASIILTREPGASELGKYIRTLLQQQSFDVDAKAEYLLFAADRAQHFKHLIIPALAEKKMVISDRLGDSSLVYQGYGRGLDLDIITTVNRWVMEGIEPDIVLYLKTDPLIARERIQKRNEKLTSFEKEDLSFTLKLVQGFQTIYEKRTNVITLEGHKDATQLLIDATHAIEQWIKDNHII